MDIDDIQKRERDLRLRNLDAWVNKVETALRHIKKYYPDYETAYYYYERLIFKNFQKRDSNKKFFLLDAGCGWRNREVMKHLDNSIYAVGADVDNESLRINISYDKLVLCNLEFLPFKNETFDMITNIGVLEHIKNPDKVLGEFERVTKSNGKYVFLLPNLLNPVMLFGKYTPTIMHVKLIGKLLERDKTEIFPTYFRLNSVNTLDKFARKYGFKRNYVITVGDFTQFIFSKFLIFTWIFFERLTNIEFINTKFRMLIVCEYEKEK